MLGFDPIPWIERAHYLTNGLSESLFVFGFEAWKLNFQEELHGFGCQIDTDNLARGRSLGQGIHRVRRHGLRKNLSWITRGLRQDSLPSESTNPG